MCWRALVAVICEGGPYPCLRLNALVVKVAKDGRVASVATVVTTAVSTDGHRKILGLDIFTSKDEAAWSRFRKDPSTEVSPACLWPSLVTTRTR
ncbi:MAG: transposase [Thermoleophilia bacterium]